MIKCEILQMYVSTKKVTAAVSHLVLTGSKAYLICGLVMVSEVCPKKMPRLVTLVQTAAASEIFMRLTLVAIFRRVRQIVKSGY